ncbi:DddA-like double-stranded DNA deaminase toxin [Allokutzneria albata]|uniref:SCP1.201-like deaminase n=1 Tax=Allokutzneria albata TaxID=211114 RepID=A0A1G9YCW6_ALLAB|nr:DddA-like double-stranded DNA deaminase toxin [Allokutzneria albata]SDN06283.1 SCP1.201-like deaminase [Allokutzneria albata]
MPSYFAEVATRLLQSRDQLAPDELRGLAEQIRDEIWEPLGHVAEGSSSDALQEALGLLSSIMTALDETAAKLDLAAEKVIDYLADTYTVAADRGLATTVPDWTSAPESRSVPHPSTLPPEAMPASHDLNWAQGQQTKLEDRPNNKGPTTGLVFFGNDTTTERVITSGAPPSPTPGTPDSVEDRADRELIAAATLILANSIRLRLRIPGAVPAVRDHVEVKVATVMRQRGITYASVVINNRKVCEDEFGCINAVPAILPHGYTLVVWPRGATKPVILKGKAQP